jgi:hypothetical protein
MIFGAGKLDHVEEIDGPRNQAASQVAVAAPSPGPRPTVLEVLACRIAHRLGDPIEPRRVVGQGRAIPEEISGDVRSGSEIRQPVLAVRVKRQVQAVGVAVPSPVCAALQASVALAPTKEGQALPLDEIALG